MHKDDILKMDARAAAFGSLMGVSNRLEVLGNHFLVGITSKQWFVTICLLMFYKEPPTLSELSKTVGSSRQNVKQLVLKLVEKGLLTLEKSPDDARALKVWYTPELIRFSEDYEERSGLLITELFSDFSKEELDLFLKSLLKFSDKIDTMLGES